MSKKFCKTWCTKLEHNTLFFRYKVADDYTHPFEKGKSTDKRLHTFRVKGGNCPPVFNVREERDGGEYRGGKMMDLGRVLCELPEMLSYKEMREKFYEIVLENERLFRDIDYFYFDKK